MLCDDLEGWGWGGGGGREAQEVQDICILMADSRCCTTETNTTLLSNYPPVKNIEQILSQFVCKYKKPQIAKSILRKKNGIGGTNLSDFRLYYKATVIRTVWFCHKI